MVLFNDLQLKNYGKVLTSPSRMNIHLIEKLKTEISRDNDKTIYKKKTHLLSNIF